MVTDHPVKLVFHCIRFDLEPFEIIEFLLSIKKYNRKYAVGVELLYPENILFKVIGNIVIAQTELSVVQDNEDLILALKLAKVLSSAFRIQPVNAVVEPDFQTTQGRCPFLFQGDLDQGMF